ncbi:hypothetical protein NL533_30915, partial [Klebsiella pneumoniae]|nr:hypothetical protein [Klebsiella pneumoniae]
RGMQVKVHRAMKWVSGIERADFQGNFETSMVVLVADDGRTQPATVSLRKATPLALLRVVGVL